MSVIAVGPHEGIFGSVQPVVVRNNTDTEVTRVEVSVVVRSAEGEMIGTGADQGLRPNVVPPGGVAVGHIFFGGATLPSDASFEFEVAAKRPGQVRFENIRDLEIVEASRANNRGVGVLRNVSDVQVSLIGVTVVCFDRDGGLLGEHRAYTDKMEAGPNETVPFQVVLASGSEDAECLAFLVAGSGFET